MKRFSISREIGGDDQAAILIAVTAAHEFASDEALPDELAARLAIVVEELVANILRHGASGSAVFIDGKMEKLAAGIHLTLIDDGVHFNPKRVLMDRDPDPQTGGGSGIPLVRAWADGLDYRSEGGLNWLELNLRA
ncbi:ATP-binding protein [Sphingomonas sp. HDW15A]|uniref:ATP-binding protein n=1 Tax=Sphingomonas sp. HDW15A TaxID=2714942 RepID=UPI00140AFA46|nr:ATP-binding protein [Sphingomonas sp. HDW15A]QIK95747.1 ATP-binding protein [Sphingomonas sp. HDW15A]